MSLPLLVGPLGPRVYARQRSPPGDPLCSLFTGAFRLLGSGVP